jgi:omega-amidase
MQITLVQHAPKLSRSNLLFVESVVREYASKSDLIVFPELALNGYMLQDKLLEDAWSFDELTPLALLSKDVDIVIGAAIKEDHSFYNTALYFHCGELLSHHKKLHLPNYGMFEEARYFQAGTLVESFMVENRKICMLVCEDLWHESVHEEVASLAPDLIIALVASPARGFIDDGLEIAKQWYAIIEGIALKASAPVCFVNRVGFEDGIGFWGGSTLMDANANNIKVFELFMEQIETLSIKIKGEI